MLNRVVHVSRRCLSVSSIRLFEASKKPKCDLNPGRCNIVPCCMKAMTNFSSNPSLLPEVEDDTWSRVIQYSKFRPNPLSIESFLHHGQHSSREVSYRFLKQEIPTRIAGLLLEFNLLPSIVQKQPSVQLVRDDHLQTFQDLIEFPDTPDTADLEMFDEKLSEVRIRHAETVSQMAEAVMNTKFELEDMKQNIDQGLESAIQYFLDRMYMTRISTRMLYNQHLYIHGDNIAKPRHVGQINPHCNVKESVERAYDEAAKLCDLHYDQHPPLQIRSSNNSSSEAEDVPILFAYVPSHLHHMVFEVIKNSMRATVEQARERGAESLEPVKVLISKTDADITVKIR